MNEEKVAMKHRYIDLKVKQVEMAIEALQRIREIWMAEHEIADLKAKGAHL